MRKALAIGCIFALIYISAFTPYHNQADAGQKTPSLRYRKYAIVKEIRYWSGPTHTRIVIDLDHKVIYKDRLLKSDLALGKPPRIYIDLTAATLLPRLKEPILIESGILKRVRAGQYTPDTVRIVLDLQSIVDYKVFPLSDPFRVVIDVLGTSISPRAEESSKQLVPPQPQPFKIVLDPGHGGEDPGAIGPTGLQEKDVVLAIAKKTRDKISKELGWDVVMTREEDRFIPLEDRTAIATTEDANLFVSIHANAAKDKNICGIESFFLGTTSNKDALRLAAKENNISPRRVSDLQIIFADLKLNDPAKVIPSTNLADCVQASLVDRLQRCYGGIRDLGIKQAPFVVLIGAEMPSILIEVSFISNPREERMLREPHYLDTIADAIVDGLRKYAHGARMVQGQSSLSSPTARSSN
jgi:N-acetylmuramoyl-L-alanine amidase